MNRTIAPGKLLAIFSFGVFALISSTAAALVIDDFSVGPLTMNLAGPFSNSQTVDQSPLAPGHVVGDARQVYAATLDMSTLKIDAAQGQFVFESGPDFGYFSLTYGANSPLDLNLLAGGNALAIEFLEVAPDLFRGIYTVSIASPGISRTTSFTQALFNLPGAGNVVIPFANFPDVDFGHVTSIVINAGRVERGGRLVIGSIHTVPEPAAAALAALACPCLFRRRR